METDSRAVGYQTFYSVVKINGQCNKVDQYTVQNPMHWCISWVCANSKFSEFLANYSFESSNEGTKETTGSKTFTFNGYIHGFFSSNILYT